MSEPSGTGTKPDRNLALELVRVTEAAAMGAGRWIGRGDKIAADQAAVDAMRAMLDTVTMDGVVVIGEGEKDEAPMLYNGERVGEGARPRGRRGRRPARGHAPDGARAAERDRRDRGRRARLDVLPGRGRLHGEDRRRRGCDRRRRHQRDAHREREGGREGERTSSATDVRVVVLERERHEQLIGELREVGARVNLIRDGDVAPAIAAARPETGVDLLYGIGGTPEGVISAAALKCVGGGIQGRALAALRRRSAQALVDSRASTSSACSRRTTSSPARTCSSPRPASRPARCSAASATFATERSPIRSSCATRSGTVRRIEARHNLDKLTQFTGREFR